MDITVHEARSILEEAIAWVGEDAHAVYLGMCDQDRNDMICAVQAGADPEAVVRDWCLGA